MTSAVAFADAASAVPDPALGAANRVDPYWAELWAPSAGGIAVTWTSRRSASNREKAGLRSQSKTETRWSPAEAQRLLLSRSRQDRLAAVAAALMWRTLTIEQLAAVTGQASLLLRSSRTRDLLWSAGLIHKGRLATEVQVRRPGQISPGFMVRAGDSAALRWFDRQLAYSEWLAVTAGQPTGARTTYSHHDVLATELSLRVAEFCPIGTVFGELLSNWRLLLDPSAGLPEGFGRAADCVWVRPDGLRIAVEVTAWTGDSFKGRADRWAQALAADRTRSTVVLFVETQPDRGGYNGWSAKMDRRVREAVEAAATRPSSLMNGVAERMAVARWRNWFPDVGAMSPSFISLEAERPTGRGDSRWEPANLLDPFEVAFPGAGEEQFTSAVANADHLLGVPHWLRRPPPLSLAAYARDAHGLPGRDQLAAITGRSGHESVAGLRI